MASEIQLINTRKLKHHLPLGLEFDFVQLAGQLAPQKREAWNADALMEGVRARARDELTSWQHWSNESRRKRSSGHLSFNCTHHPDKLNDYINKVLVETGQRFFKREPIDAPGYSDLAAQRREFLSQRLEARRVSGWTAFGSRTGLTVLRSWSEKSALRRNS